jgi:hypothetical protein
MKLTIRKRDNGDFEVEDMSLPGSPPVGYGKHMMEAIGRFFHAHQTRLGIEFEVDESAVPAEMRRRQRELRRR